jgi:menaquinone-dependent protoporphyrinogen oxidase
MPIRVLVAYATKHGSTREIAEAVGRVLRGPDSTVDVLATRAVTDLAPYDAVVLGSALYAAHWQRDANRFVARHLAALQRRPVWLFSSGPLDRSADAGTLPVAPSVARTTEPIGARAHRTFGGRLLPGTPGIDEQIFATHPIGDFRDFAAIEAWAAGIARALEREPGGG